MKEFLMNLTTKQKIILGIIATIIMIIIFIFAYKYFYIDTNKEESTEIEQSTNEAINNDINEIGYEGSENLDDGILNSKKKKSAIIVHIIGEVNKPGVVKLEEGARIIDAISAAGGQTENADLSKVNLAYIVEDGTQIYIPKYNENLTDISLIREDAGEGIIKESVVNNETSTNKTKVNINTATKEKLITLPGIGDSMAEKIIEYRTQNGKFEKVEDIKKVSGIGESKFNNIKDMITIK